MQGRGQREERDERKAQYLKTLIGKDYRGGEENAGSAIYIALAQNGQRSKCGARASMQPASAHAI
eukprot:6085107-Pleurochrysis_carterae.AAC.1